MGIGPGTAEPQAETHEASLEIEVLREITGGYQGDNRDTQCDLQTSLLIMLRRCAIMGYRIGRGSMALETIAVILCVTLLCGVLCIVVRMPKGDDEWFK